MKRKVKDTMQWAVYLGLSGVLGMAWLPFGRHVAKNFEDVIPQDRFFEGNLWAWMLLMGVLNALSYRALLARTGGKEPKPWVFACFFPFVTVLAHMIVHTVLGFIPPNPFALGFYLIFGVCLAYIIYGWLIIPLAILQTMLLGLAHRKLAAFPDSPSNRTYRHALWALGCIGLLGIVEAPRVYDRVTRGRYEAMLAEAGLTLPPGSRFHCVLWGEYGPTGYWFHVSKPVEWPKHSSRRKLTEPDEREAMNERLAGTDIPVDGSTEFLRANWSRGKNTMQGTLVRTERGDYLEVTEW
jgi:hypothetical protein